eukprot:scaffold125201_cov69-Phaeocystis_antarctica.AAC.1
MHHHRPRPVPDGRERKQNSSPTMEEQGTSPARGVLGRVCRILVQGEEHAHGRVAQLGEGPLELHVRRGADEHALDEQARDVGVALLGLEEAEVVGLHAPRRLRRELEQRLPHARHGVQHDALVACTAPEGHVAATPAGVGHGCCRRAVRASR